jgi:hypothetical protein
MGFNSGTCLWLTRPVHGSTIFESLLEKLKQEKVTLNSEEIYFHDLSSGEERPAEPVGRRSIGECFEALLDWPALGGTEVLHPDISAGIFLELHNRHSHYVDFLTLSMLYGSTSGEHDEKQLFLFSRSLFSKIEEFGLLYGESPERNTFRADEYFSFVDALSKVHELQIKKENGEKGFFEKIILTRSLDTT